MIVRSLAHQPLLRKEGLARETSVTYYAIITFAVATCLDSSKQLNLTNAK